MPAKRKSERIKAFDPNYPDSLLLVVKNAPLEPGCYLFKDKLGYVIYVGKAKSLRARVRSYFAGAAREDERVIPMLPAIDDVEFRVTATELDALILEYRLIKELKPRFNALMVDEQKRQWLRISIQDEYPALSVEKAQAGDRAAYFDIVLDEYDGAEIIEAINALWKTPLCGRELPGRTRQCIYGETGACMGPCERRVSGEEYRQTIAEIVDHLQGKCVQRIDDAEAAMNKHALRMNYEKAAELKALLDKAERIKRRAARSVVIPSEGDAIVIARAYRSGEAALFLFRDGCVTLREDVLLSDYAPKVRAFAEAILAGERHAEGNGWVARALMEMARR